MSAVIQIHEMSSLTAGTNKTAGTVRFKDADNATVDSSNVLVVPPTGINYSFTKKIRAFMSTAPNTQISSFRWYSDGSSGYGTGIGVQAKNLGTTWGANYKTAMSGGTNYFSLVVGAPMNGSVTHTGPYLPAAQGTYIGDLIELQMSVADTATPGTKPAESLTLAFDEI